MTYEIDCQHCDAVGQATNWTLAQELIAGHEQLHPDHKVTWTDRDGGDAA